MKTTVYKTDFHFSISFPVANTFVAAQGNNTIAATLLQQQQQQHLYTKTSISLLHNTEPG